MSKIKVSCEKITPMKGERKIADNISRDKNSYGNNSKKENSKTPQDVKNKITPMTSELKPINGPKPGK